MRPLTPRLKDPPIVEVVCGFFFSPLPGLDPLLIGKYWAEQKEKNGYKNRQLQPPVTDRPGLTLMDGVAPVRSMLISDSDEYVLQIQPDRFYFNWRRREGLQYPHFNDYREGEGVLTKGLREFAELAEFCARTLDRRPTPLRVELAKIDQLVQSKHYRDFADLETAMPMVQAIRRMTTTFDPIVQLNIVDERDGCDVHLQLTNAVLGLGANPSVQLETRASKELVGDPKLRESFIAMNGAANAVFFGMFNDADSTWDRFGGRDK